MSRPAFPVLAAWIFVIAVAFLSFIVSLFQHRDLQTPRFYLFYCAAAGAVQLFIRYHYPTLSLYWAFELANDVLLLFISVELLSILLPLGLTALFAIPCLSIAAFVIQEVVPDNTSHTNRWIAGVKTIIIGGILLTAVLFGRKKWTKEYRLVFAGVVLLLALGAISSWVWLVHRLGYWGGILGQLSPVPGLIFLALAGRKRGTKRPIILTPNTPSL